MSKIKTIYFEDDLIEQIGETKNFSERVKELIRKGLYAEKKGEEMSMHDLLESFVKKFNKNAKRPVYILKD